MKIIFAAGGTGGHINPALAAAGEIRENYPDAEILFVGTKDKMEAKLVPQAGFAFEGIAMSGFQRKLSVENIIKNIKTVWRVLFSGFAVKRIIKKFNPDVVVGFGGYVSGPVVRKAAKMGIKTAIHEQNAFPGVTNKLLAKNADAVMVAVPKAKEYLECKNEPIVTGLPVRNEILRADKDFARAEMGIKDDETVIFSFGGSLGAKTINTAMVDIIAEFTNEKNCRFIHGYGQYGKWVPDALKEKGVDIGNKNIDVREYIYDMDKCLAAADIVVCRSGASTLSELQTVGKASILIPSPNVSENHQYHNAMTLVNASAAYVIEEKDLTHEKLSTALRELIENPVLRKKMEENAKKLAVADSQKIIAEIITGLI
ncbi:MAG: undecaprenyldiphospho-muramoylpentapeptide beta-N-acetylglucosaminyltransferase [Clostridia bacterium]|nr:undecaprenyldiphospho-muramoylpentapeptide beta-N-acetylglucosaminyltransferase [Clostridia bacterium]